MNRVAVIGMVGNSAFLSLDHFHEKGETVTAKSLSFEPGGKGFNQAVAAARYGAEVSFLGAVGTEGAEEIRLFLSREGIRGVLPQKPGPTAYAAILTDSQGENRVTVYRGEALCTEDLSLFEEEIRKADVLLLNHEVPEEINELAAQWAKESGTTVILNPAPVRSISPALRSRTDLFTPNEHEAKALREEPRVIVTLGKDGCLLREQNLHLPALPLSNPVDSTGAGDCFNGVLAALLSRGASLREAAAEAVAAAGVSVTRYHAATAMPSREEVYRYLEKERLSIK